MATALVFALAVSWGATLYNEWPLRSIRTALDEERYGDALNQINRFLSQNPSHGRASSLKARALVGLGMWNEAATTFQISGAEGPDELHDWATALMHLQRWSDALPLLEQTLRIEPKNADALHEVTACYARLGKHDAALASATEFSKLPNCAARGNLLIGTLHREVKNHRSAVDAWNRVVELMPNADDLQIPAAEFFSEYGAALIDVGEVDAGVESLKRSIDIQPTTTAYVALADGYSQSGDRTNQQVVLKKALAIDPQNPTARKNLAELALQNRNAQQALQWLGPLLEHGDIKSSTAYLAQRAYTIIGDKDSAATWRERATALRKREQLMSTVNHVLIEAPQSFWAHVIRAYRFAEAGNWQQAQTTLNRVLSEGSSEPFVKALSVSIQDRGALPSLELLPIEQF